MIKWLYSREQSQGQQTFYYYNQFEVRREHQVINR